MSAKRRLRVGLIGLGRLGRVYARDLATRIPETRLVAVADTDAKALAEVSAAYDVRAATRGPRRSTHGPPNAALSPSSARAVVNVV